MLESMAVLLLVALNTSKVHSIYVAGTSESTMSVIHKLAIIDQKYGDDACFRVVPNPKEADATLEVNQAETSGGINALAVLGNGPTTTTVVTARLENKAGDTIWQDSKQGMAGINSTGAGNGAEKILESMYKASGCDKKGKRE